MDNDSSFLRLVTPEPLHALFEPKADNLLRPLVRVFGTPGSGKTTLAHLVSFRRMVLVVRQYHEVSVFEPLMSALMACRFAVENAPLIVATRVPCETIYRDFHELPYGDDLKFRLMWSLIQARAMLGWINEMLGAGISLDDIRFEPREGAEVLMEEIVGTSQEEIRTRAREAERAIHEVATALLPMGESELCLQVQRRYDPLSALGNIVVTNRDEEEWRLRPLLILDDVHGLHPEQRNRLEQELKRRETGIGRWMMMRLDALGPETVLGQGSDDLEHPNAGTQKNRDYYDIHFQELTRGKQAKKFVACMLTKMADNYLKRWDIFNTRQVASFSQLLDEVPKELTPNMLDKLECRVNATQEKLGISATEREKIKQEVADFFEKRNDDEAGLCLMSESILIHRYANRRGANQLSLFDDPQDIQVPKMNLRIIHAARLELGRRYKRPYYFGMDTLIAASSHHPETFLQLAGHLAQYAQTRSTTTRRRRFMVSTVPMSWTRIGIRPAFGFPISVPKNERLFKISTKRSRLPKDWISARCCPSRLPTHARPTKMQSSFWTNFRIGALTPVISSTRPRMTRWICIVRSSPSTGLVNGSLKDCKAPKPSSPRQAARSCHWGFCWLPWIMICR